jgi:arginyl-tRNA synthetase
MHCQVKRLDSAFILGVIMETLLKLLSKKAGAAFDTCGYPGFGTVTVSDRPDLCQFQCNDAFSAAKRYKKPPALIAAQVMEILEKDVAFGDFSVAGAGFINLSLKDAFLQDYIGSVIADAHLGIPQAEAPETILLDYGGPNVAKPLHIGHLRSAVIGEALKGIAKAAGHRVISDVHLGDWGLQIGLVIAELQERYPDDGCFSDETRPAARDMPSLTAEALGEIYPSASKKSKHNEAFRRKAQEITAQLQRGHPGYRALWQEIVRVSVSDIKKSYEAINVSFDHWLGESDAQKYVPALLDRLGAEKLLYESEGAQVVDVSEPGDRVDIPPVIIKKTDDSDIYATTDLATIIQRKQDFNPDQIWYVVDNRQSLHFTQVFRCAHKAGLAGDTKLEHLGFGTVNGPDGKPYKTRDGGVMPLMELYEAAVEAAYRRVSASDYSTADEKTDIARKTAVAALKFGDLCNHRSKDYVFELDKFLAPEGKTGAFLLYTVARINRIISKLPEAGTEAAFAGRIYGDAERELLLALSLNSEAFVSAYRDKAPHYVCEAAYRIAAAFSRFYQSQHILSEPDPVKKRSWLTLCMATRAMMVRNLDALGMEPVEAM